MSGSIWDSMKRSEPTSSSDDNAGMFTIRFATESAKVEAGVTLREGLRSKKHQLGYDGDRLVSWKGPMGVVDENTPGKAGTTYYASVNLEAKG